MIVLLDTHALLWALSGSPRLSKVALRTIKNPRNTILVSVVSAWEMQIKQQLGRLRVPDDLESVVATAGFTARLITFADVRRLGELPDHHRDPFDRMLVAQALEAGVPIVTADAQIAAYQVQIVW